jgi:FAD/FMN-containing dehydrogenase
MTLSGFRGVYRTDEAARAVYAETAGIARAMPRAVAVPADGDDVCALVRWAHDTGASLIPRGSGSSMANGALGDGVIVDLSRLNSIDIEAPSHRARCGTGAVCGDVDRLARDRALRFPVDPSSAAFCTVGGMCATNASGAHTLRYGPTRSWVVALDCVFDDGARRVIRRGEPPPDDIAALSRFSTDVAADARASTVGNEHPGVRKDSSGYAFGQYARSSDLVDLLVGSEGTLALFVGAEIALAPVPGATGSVLAAFGSLEDAVVGAGASREANASACELLDRTFLEFVSRDAPVPVPAGTEAVLIVELEAVSAETLRSEAQALAATLALVGATHVQLGLTAETEHALWSLRHAASPILSRLDPSLKSMQFIEDGAVPPTRLPEYVRGVRAALERHNVRGVIFGHAGDANIHANALVDVARAGWRDAIVALLDDVVELTSRLGGTLSGEHGDGRLRTPLLARTWSAEAIELMTRIKRAFDPADILNPGVKVALPGQTPLGAIKYDPSLTPLPAEARAVLDRVERERAYAHFRLGMLEESR